MKFNKATAQKLIYKIMTVEPREFSPEEKQNSIN